jgi:hypothetical protein
MGTKFFETFSVFLSSNLSINFLNGIDLLYRTGNNNKKKTLFFRRINLGEAN